MDRHDIVEMTDSYASAARRLKTAGFDGLEVYLAHGYLLCEFLSRFSNTRNDSYGGIAREPMPASTRSSSDGSSDGRRRFPRWHPSQR